MKTEKANKTEVEVNEKLQTKSSTFSSILIGFYFFAAFICAIGATYSSFRLHSSFGWWVGFILFSFLAAKCSAKNETKPDDLAKSDYSIHEADSEQSKLAIKSSSTTEDNKGFNIAIIILALLITFGCVVLFIEISKAQSWPFIPSLTGILFPYPFIFCYLVCAFFFVAIISSIIDKMTIKYRNKNKINNGIANQKKYSYTPILSLFICFLGSAILIISAWVSATNIGNRYNELFGESGNILGTMETVQYTHRYRNSIEEYHTYKRQIHLLNGDLKGANVEFDTNVKVPGYEKITERANIQIVMLSSWLGHSVTAVQPMPADATQAGN